jgi:hypothetical protein
MGFQAENSSAPFCTPEIADADGVTSRSKMAAEVVSDGVGTCWELGSVLQMAAKSNQRGVDCGLEIK